MFSQKELNQIAQKKKRIIARSDVLRREAGEIWSVVGRSTDAVEQNFSRLKWLPPVVSLVSAGAAVYLKTRSGRGGRLLEPFLALASAAMRPSRKPAPPERVPVSRQLPEGE